MVIFAKPNNCRIKKLLHQIKENIVLRRLVPTSGQFAVVCEKKNNKIDKNPKNFRNFRAFEANKIAPVENFRKVFTQLERASSCLSFWKVWMVAEK